MPDSLWLRPKDGDGPLAIIVDEQGRPIICEECPCYGGDCTTAVDDKVSQYLAMTDPDTHQQLWRLQGTSTADYHCATWSYDSITEEWTLVSTASGELLVALRYSSTVADTAESSAVLLVYAKTLVNNITSEYMVVGCQCRVSRYECVHKLVTVPGYAIAGRMPVWQPEAGDTYTPGDSCRVDTCNLLKFKLDVAAQWHGGSVLGEGYYDWLLTPGYWDAANYRYQPFLKAVVWYSGNSDSITCLDCNCTSIATHLLGPSEAYMEYPGICTLQDPCIALMLLHNRAVANGWDWYDEGIIAHLAFAKKNNNILAYGDWYAIREQVWQGNYDYSEDVGYIAVMCCAETPDGYWIIGCGCSGLDYLAKNEPVAGYRQYFALPGICACERDVAHGTMPDREILLTYPQEFGVVDIVWGNDNKFDYTYDTQNYESGVLVTRTYTGRSICGQTEEPIQGAGGRTMYIDYRAMCFTGKAFNELGAQKLWVRVVYPSGSRGATRGYFSQTDDYYASGGGAFYDTASFPGAYYTPFDENNDVGYTITSDNGAPAESYYGRMNFTGTPYVWLQDSSGATAQINGCQPTQHCDPWYDSYSDKDMIEEMAGCDSYVPGICISVVDRGASYWKYAPLLSPDLTVASHPCSTSWNGSYWCWTSAWITYGANVSNAPNICVWLFLNIHYVCTNRGLIVKGLNGYQETYTLPNPRLHYPQYTHCGEWDYYYYDDDEEPQDTIIQCPADEDMHFCTTDFVIPDDEEEEEIA